MFDERRVLGVKGGGGGGAKVVSVERGVLGERGVWANTYTRVQAVIFRKVGSFCLKSTCSAARQLGLFGFLTRHPLLKSIMYKESV